MALLQRLSFMLFFMALIGCGGGDGGLTNTGGSGGGTSQDPITINLAISDVTVTGQAPATITATVMQGSSVVSGAVVTFTNTLGALSPTSGTALTNAEGVATIVLTAGDVRGAGDVTATLFNGEDAKISFTSQGDDVSVVGDINITMALVDTNGEATQTITSSKPGKVIATVNGISSPIIVTFTSTVGDMPITTAITNDNHQAEVDIYAGGTLGAGTIVATIASGETGEVLLVVGASNVEMGSGTPFVEGNADVSLAQISAGGTTVVSVLIIDDQGNLFTEAVDVHFSSGCTSQGTPTATLSSPIMTANGMATSTYLAKGCVGDDPINVTANAGGINLSATASVNVLAADVGSIEFVSASPQNIAILGTGAVGGSESSTVVFRVLDTNSNPVNNQNVDFQLNTDVGGIQLIPSRATTDNNGLVQTVINSGTVATTVRVKATITGSEPQISSQSSLLVVSTGIPDQDSFTLSASILNPEGWSLDGTEVSVTARLADAFNNPVPDGTAVIFTTEGGSIDPSCITEEGACNVIWRSQFPKPEGHILGDANNLNHLPETTNTMGQKFGGRASISATAIGEESFPDLNGNGRFDETEISAFLGTDGYSGNDVSGKPYDLKEAFVDHNEDGVYNPGETGGTNVNGSGDLEEFADFNDDGSFTVNDGKYNGVLCAIPAHEGCSNEQKSINVRGGLVLVMSGSDPFFRIETPILNIVGEGSASASVIISDLHNQPMPAGSVVSFSAGVGSIVGPSSFIWPNHNKNGGSWFGVTVKGEKEPKSGQLAITVETPNGVVTGNSTISINIQ
jgi:hypothetical protein